MCLTCQRILDGSSPSLGRCLKLPSVMEEWTRCRTWKAHQTACYGTVRKVPEPSTILVCWVPTMAKTWTSHIQPGVFEVADLVPLSTRMCQLPMDEWKPSALPHTPGSGFFPTSSIFSREIINSEHGIKARPRSYVSGLAIWDTNQRVTTQGGYAFGVQDLMDFLAQGLRCWSLEVFCGTGYV